MLMSQQRPDRIKQVLHYLWQHGHHSQRSKLLSFLAMQGNRAPGFHYIVPAVIGRVWFAAMVVLFTTTVRKIKNMFSIKRTLQSEGQNEIAALLRS